jgi:DNA invertase Pin-like site-specific DNA recombinase
MKTSHQNPKSSEGKRVVGYVREAGGLPKDDSAFVGQKEEVQQWCRRNGFKIMKIYVEEWFTGGRTVQERPALRALLDDAFDGKFDILVAVTASRLAREVTTLTDIIKALEGAKVGVVTTREGIDLTESIEWHASASLDQRQSRYA